MSIGRYQITNNYVDYVFVVQHNYVDIYKNYDRVNLKGFSVWECQHTLE